MEWRRWIGSDDASTLHARLVSNNDEVNLERLERVPLYVRFTVGHIASQAARDHATAQPKGAVP